jgi:hypothetical protein
LADTTYYVDPTGVTADFVTIFPSLNDAIPVAVSDLLLELTAEILVLPGGDAFNGDFSYSDTANGHLIITFLSPSPGWYDPGGAARNAFSYVGQHLIDLSFRNLTINNWMGYAPTLTIISDQSFGATSVNVNVNGLVQISGAVHYRATGRAAGAATMTVTAVNQALYDCAFLITSDGQLGNSTLTSSFLNCEHGAECVNEWKRIGAGATLTRTLKNYYAYAASFQDPNLTPTSVNCQNIFYEGFIGYGLDAQFGGSGHTEIEQAFPQPVCIVFPGHPAEDLRRTGNSPLINSGVNAGVAFDFNGNARSATPTLGAFELVAADVRRHQASLGIRL